MYLRKIKLEAFRSHVDTTLDLAPLTFIRSPNGAGKSSIAQAIELALAGRCEGTTADGKGSLGLIRHGAVKASVTLALRESPDATGDERLLKMALNDTRRAAVVTKPSDPQYGGSAEYLDYLALHRDVLSCLCNNRHFVDLKESEQKDILARIILPKTYAWPEWVVPSANELGLKINWARTPFEIIDQAYDAAFKARTDANRDVKNFRAPEGDTAEAANLESYRKRAEELRRELDGLRKQQMAAEKANAEATAQRTAAVRRLEEAQTRLNRAPEEVGQFEDRLLGTAKFKELEKSAKEAARAEILDVEIARLTAELAANRRAFDALNTLSEQPACPTCSQVLTEEAVAAIAQPIMAAKDKLTASHRDAVDARKALGNPAEAKAKVDAHHQAAKDLARVRQRVAEEQAIVRDATEKLDALGKALGRPAEDGQSDILAVTKAIDDTAEAIHRAEQAADLARRKASAKDDLAALTQRAAGLNRLVEFFGADGVKAELLASTIGGFTHAMNASLSKWGFTCQLTIEPYRFAVMFQDGGGKPFATDLKFLSKSQRYRFATAFQIALAQVSGFRFVIVDEADIYDADGKAGLFEALTSGDLDQAIVLATDEREDAPDIDGATFYRLDDIAAPGAVPTTRTRRLLPAKAEAA